MTSTWTHQPWSPLVRERSRVLHDRGVAIWRDSLRETLFDRYHRVGGDTAATHQHVH